MKGLIARSGPGTNRGEQHDLVTQPRSILGYAGRQSAGVGSSFWTSLWKVVSNAGSY